MNFFKKFAKNSRFFFENRKIKETLMKTKKLVIAVALLVLVVAAYLAQVAYIGSLNQKFFELQTQDNELLTLTDKHFEKGFFTSKASFAGAFNANAYPFNQLAPNEAAELSELFSFEANLRFKNNIFAKDNVIIELKSPAFEVLSEIFAGKVKVDKDFLTITAGVSVFGKVKVKAKIADIDFKEGANSFKLVGLVSQSELDLQGLLKNGTFKVDELVYVDASGVVPFNFELKALNYELDYGKGVKISDYATAAESKGVGSIKSLKVADLTLLELKSTQSAVKKADDDDFISTKSNFGIKSIVSPLFQVEISDLNGEFDMDNISLAFVQALNNGNLMMLNSPEILARAFFASNPALSLKSLNFNSKGKKFSSKGEMTSTQDGYKLHYEALSEARLGEILPPLAMIGIDGIFIEKDGKYALNFDLESDFRTTKINLNGEEEVFANDFALPYGEQQLTDDFTLPYSEPPLIER